jgi:hypothetical protein
LKLLIILVLLYNFYNGIKTRMLYIIKLKWNQTFVLDTRL